MKKNELYAQGFLDKTVFLAQLPVAICVFSREGVVEFANEAYGDFIGAPCHELLGRPIAQFSLECARNVSNDFITFDRGGTVPRHEFFLNQKKYLVTVRPIVDDNDEVSGIVACLADMGGLKKSVGIGLVEDAEEDAEQSSVSTSLDVNKEAFYAAMAQQLQSMLDKKQPLSLVLLEIDDFLAYFQYEARDGVNATLSQLLDLIRSVGGSGVNLLYRYDQEKFAIILPDRGLKSAATLAEQLRSAIFNANIANHYSDHGRVTVSVGVYTENAVISYMRIFNGADNALYLARKNGKNRVEVY